MNYYYLIAGLPDIKIEDNKLTYSIADFKKEALPKLSAVDARLFEMFYMKFDNQNLLHYLAGEGEKFDERGNMSKDELDDCLQLINNGSKPKNKNFPSYFVTLISEYKSAQQPDTEAEKWENRITELYYQWAMKCGNKLISDWFEFNLNLNNILAAYTSRKYKMNVEVLGNNKVAELIKTSKQRDFGLSEIIEDADIFQRLADESDLFEREKRIDLLKWQWLDEQAFFKYFSIEIIFAYLIKLEIIERWVSLDPVEGGKIFRELINSLKESVVNQK